MNSIKFFCGQCGQSLEVDDDMAGRTTTCPACQCKTLIPGKMAEKSIEIAGNRPAVTRLTYKHWLAVVFVMVVLVSAGTGVFNLVSSLYDKYTESDRREKERQEINRSVAERTQEDVRKFLEGYCNAWCKLSRSPSTDYTSLDPVSIFCTANRYLPTVPSFGITDYEILVVGETKLPEQEALGFEPSFAFSLRVTVMNRAGAPMGTRRVEGEINCGKYGGVSKISLE